MYNHTHALAKAALLKQISREYVHEHVNRDLIRDVIEIYIKVSLQSYQDDFEKFLLEAKHQHYQRMAEAWKETDSFPEYLKKAECCLKAEEESAASYLHPSSKQAVKKVVQQELLEKTQVSPRSGALCMPQHTHVL